MSHDDRPDRPEGEHDLDEINHRWAGRALATGRIAGSALRLAARGLLRRGRGRHGDSDSSDSSDSGAGDEAIDATAAGIGARLARELDQMKGLAMKVGQILSYLDGALPPETQRALRALQRGARPVAFSVMARVIEDAFGQPADELFDAFDPAPVAAASIGQVYRARLGGRDVAVKVQYPNVRATLAADLRRIRRLSSLASLATAVDGPAIARELEARVLEECDYLREAAHQAWFGRAFAADPDVRIPDIISERTRATVLTSQWCRGLDFYAFAEAAGPDRRSEVGLVLARFAYRSLLGLGAVNADPHPGNYVLSAAGGDPVVFLDFGCVRRFDPAFLAAERRLARVVIDDRRDAFRDAVIATGVVPRPERFDFDAHWDMLCHQYAPYRASRFAFTPAYVRAGAAFTGPGNPNLRRMAIPPEWIWVQRLQWGLHAVLARLGAEGPFADVLRAALDAPTAPDELPPWPP